MSLAWNVWVDCPLKLIVDKQSFTRIEFWMDNELKALNDKWVGPIKASSLFAFVCWYIWKGRNDWVFNGVKPNSKLIIDRAISLSLEHQSVSRSISKSFLDVSCLGPSSPRWVAPCPGSFKIN